MQVEMQNLESKLEDVYTKVSSILILMKGHHMDDTDRGMIGELKDHEQRITYIEKIKDRFAYFLIGLALPAGWGIIDIIKTVFVK